MTIVSSFISSLLIWLKTMFVEEKSNSLYQKSVKNTLLDAKQQAKCQCEGKESSISEIFPPDTHNS